ncbi:MFS transporter [Maricaulaceae bacterium EIL42A08]|nr:MFS transporter [Maricaulaceae bacterium EIL42A08]
MPGKLQSLAIIAVCQVLALSVWFAGAAALPALQVNFTLSPVLAAGLSSAVQVGFVVGALLSASFNLPDRFDPRAVFAFGAALAGLSSLAASLISPDTGLMIILRVLSGAALALVYPVGMKLAASWAKGDAGLLVGLLVGALTLGSAMPHLSAPIMASSSWQTPFLASAALALIAAGLIFLARAGPAFPTGGTFKPGAAFTALNRRDIRNINLGYLGHMWELYAFWAWVGVFIVSWQVERGLGAEPGAGGYTFAIIAIGAIGALAAGWLADRFGRMKIAGTALALGGLCALASPLVWTGPGWLLGGVLAIYGVAVIADSAQFSAAIAERAPTGLAGSLLTLQTALGFGLTVISVQLLPVWAEVIGWQYALVPLAIGPALGLVALSRLRKR